MWSTKWIRPSLSSEIIIKETWIFSLNCVLELKGTGWGWEQCQGKLAHEDTTIVRELKLLVVDDITIYQKHKEIYLWRNIWFWRILMLCNWDYSSKF